MQYKLSFLAGLATGYVVGARAGRERYEQIRRGSARAWQSGPVQSTVAQAADAVKAKTPAPAHALVDKAADAMSGSSVAGARDASRAANPVGMPGMPVGSTDLPR